MRIANEVTPTAPNKRDPKIPIFAFEAAPHGRLTFIRTLSLVFAAHVDGGSGFEWQISPALRDAYQLHTSTMLPPFRMMTRPPGALRQFEHVFDRERHAALFAPAAREEWRSVLGFKGVWYRGEQRMKLKSSIRFPELDYLVLDFGQLGLGSGIGEGVYFEEGAEEDVDVSFFFCIVLLLVSSFRKGRVGASGCMG